MMNFLLLLYMPLEAPWIGSNLTSQILMLTQKNKNNSYVIFFPALHCTFPLKIIFSIRFLFPEQFAKFHFGFM